MPTTTTTALGFALLCIVHCGTSCAPALRSGPRLNVLLLCVDDLRPEIAAFGKRHAVTPNLDRLAHGSVAFHRHYVQFPTCGASRRALLTGRGPSLPAHWGNDALGTQRGADAVPTLPGTFRAAGYRTISLGKVSHHSGGRRPDGSREMPGAWSSLPTEPGPWAANRWLLHAYADGVHRQAGKSPLWQARDGPDNIYPDGRLAGQAITALQECAARDEPFFLAVGFYKPHLPFCAPRTYWDLYDPATLPLPGNRTRPAGLGPVHSCRQSGEVTNNYACPQWSDRRWDRDEIRAMLHGYLACVSYVDAQIGRVLAALEETGLARDTIVVLWGDHGWHLGEQGLMGKHTTFDSALRSPLVVRVPGAEPAVNRNPVASLDLFPTLCFLCGVCAPPGLDGQVLPLAEMPAGNGRAIPSWWRTGGHRAEILHTQRWRLVRWYRPGDPESAAIELWDLQGDPGETRNAALEHPEIVASLLEQLPNRSH